MKTHRTVERAGAHRQRQSARRVYDVSFSGDSAVWNGSCSRYETCSDERAVRRTFYRAG